MRFFVLPIWLHHLSPPSSSEFFGFFGFFIELLFLGAFLNLELIWVGATGRPLVVGVLEAVTAPTTTALNSGNTGITSAFGIRPANPVPVPVPISCIGDLYSDAIVPALFSGRRLGSSGTAGSFDGLGSVGSLGCVGA